MKEEETLMSELSESLARTMFSRRDFLRLSSVATASALLAACGPKETPAPMPEEEPEPVEEPVSEPGEESVGTVEVRLQDWSGDWEEFAVEQFTEWEGKNPGIKVVYEAYQDDWQERTLAAMVAGTAPDIIHAWGDVFRTFSDRGQLLNLESLFQQTYSLDEKKDFHAYQLEAMVRDGFRWAMPKHVWLGIMYYNKDMFDEAGMDYPDKSWTHDDYGMAMEKLTVRDSSGEPTRWGGYVPAWSYDRIVPKIQAWGGNACDQETHTKSMLGDDPAQEALEWVRSRMWDSNVIAQQLQVENQNGYNSLIAGLVATAEEGTSHLVRVGNTFEGNFDIVHHPKGPVDRVSLGGSNGYAVYKGVEERGNYEQTWEVMQFLMSPEFQRGQLRSTARTIVPGRLSVIPDFLDKVKELAPALQNVNVEVILEALEEGYPRANDQETFKNHAAAAEIITPALEKIFIVGDSPVSLLVELTADIEATQS
jgi:multiple sugar transport system substrate-binding protein